jgi:hypothetical protein
VPGAIKEAQMLYTMTLNIGTFPVMAAFLPLLCLIKEKRDERERA